MAVKKTILGIIFLGLGIFLIVGLFLRFSPQEILQTILRLSWLDFSIILLLTLAGFAITTWRGKLILDSQGAKISFVKLFFVNIAGNAFIYSPFVYVGGEGAKAYLLNKRFGIVWRKTGTFLVLENIFEFTAAFVVVLSGVVGLVFILGVGGLTSALWVVIAIVAGTTLLLALFFLVLFKKKQIFSNVFKFLRLNKTLVAKVFAKFEQDVLNFFDLRSKIMWQAWFLSLFRQFVLLGRQILMFYFLGKGVLFVAPFISLSAIYLGFMTLIPGALGAQEAFQGIVFSIFTFSAGEGVALSFILRAVDVFIVGFGVIIIVRYGLRFLTDTREYLKNNN